MTRRSTTSRRLLISKAAQIFCENLEGRLNFSPLTWSAGPSLPAARDHGVAINTGYYTIFVSGPSASYVQSSDGLAAWTSGQTVPNIGTQMGFALSTGATGGMIVYGGKIGGSASPDATTYAYNNADLINDIQPMQVSRSGLGSGSYGGYAYAIGGQNGATIYSSVERYNATSDSWSYVAPIPTARYGFATVDDHAGHFYVIGGATANNTTSVSNNVYKYDAASNTWSSLTSLPTAIREAGASLAMDSSGNAYIYVVGGSTGSGVTNLIQRYDVANNTWDTTQTALPVALKGAAVTTDSGGRLEVIGGINSSNVAVNTVYLSQQLNQPDVAPTITSTPVTKGSADKPYTYQLTATGNPSAVLSLTAAPNGMTISSTGLISWQPLASQVGLQHVVVHASNFAGAVDQTFDVNVVLETNPPANVTNAHFVSSTTNSISISWDPGTDDTAVASYNIYYSHVIGYRPTRRVFTLVGTSNTTSFTQAGLSQLYTRTYYVKAVDTSGNISTGYSNGATGTTLKVPTLSLYSGTSVTATALHPVAFSLYSSANPAASFSLISGPNGMTVDPASGLVKWIPGVADVGNVPATFRVTNSVGQADLTINIVVNPDRPVLYYQINPGTGPSYGVAGQPMTVKVNDLSFTPSTYTLSIAPAGMTIDSSTGLISWTPTYADKGTTNVVVGATNSAGSSSITIPVTTYFTGKPTAVIASNITSTSATINWTPPTDTSHVNSYAVKLWYRARSGRAYTTKSFNYTAPAGATSLNVSGFTAYKTYGISVTAVDSAASTGEPGYGTSFIANTPPALPPTMPLAGLPSNGVASGSKSVVTFSAPLNSSRLPINVSFDDPTSAYAAYYDDLTNVIQAAGDQWGRIFQTSSSLDVVVTFDDTLATTSAASLASQFVETDASGNSIYEPGAATKINSGIDINGASPDIQINIGVDPTNNYLADHLWFDPDVNSRSAPVPGNKVDAVSVMMHELGHAIGLNGWVDPATGSLPGAYMSTFDQYVYASDTGNYAFSGGSTNALNSAVDITLDGSIYHTSGIAGDLMDGAGLSNGTRYNISAMDIAVMQDLGMSMDSTAPILTSLSYIPGTVSTVQLSFNESVQNSLSNLDFSLLHISAAGAEAIPTTGYAVKYDVATNSVQLQLGSSPLADGQYILTLGASGVADRVGNALPYDVPLQFQILSGDVNSDGHVDSADQAIISSNLGKTGATLADGDANHDGVVDAADSAIATANDKIWLPAIGEVDLPTTAGDDSILLWHEAGAFVDLFAGGATLTSRIPSYAAAGLTLTGNTGNDTLTLDYVNGTPFSGGSITFDGGDGVDRLVIDGSTGADTITINSVTTVVNGSTSHYTAEEVIVDGKNGNDNLAIGTNVSASSAGTQSINQLTIGSGGTFLLPAGSAQRLNLKLLSLTNTSKLDLNDNSLVVDYTGGSSSLTTMQNLIKSGLHQLGGSGYGITSTLVDQNNGDGTTLGMLDNAQTGGQLRGVPLNAILIKYTWFGDTNLDGRVDGSDYALLDSGFTSGGALGGWLYGDFDGSGTVDGADYALIDTGFIDQNRIL